MDVLRPLPLGKSALGPRELEVDLGVQGFLRRRHASEFVAGGAYPPAAGDERRPGTGPDAASYAYAVLKAATVAESSARRRRIRSAIGGCVEKSVATPAPRSGFAM